MFRSGGDPPSCKSGSVVTNAPTAGCVASGLVERGAAVPYQGHDFWPISPNSLARKHGKRQFLLALRISDPALVFREAITPASVEAIFGEDPNESIPSTAPCSAPASDANAPSEPPELEEWKPGAEEHPAIVPSGPSVHGDPGRGPSNRDRGAGSDETTARLSTRGQQQERRRPEQASRSGATPGDQERGQGDKVDRQLALEVARKAIAQLGPAGEALLRIVDAADAESLFLRAGKGLLLRWDDRLDRLVDRERLLADLGKTKAVQVDAMAPFQLVREIGGVPGMAFSTAVGRSISTLLEARVRPTGGPAMVTEKSRDREEPSRSRAAAARSREPSEPDRENAVASPTKPVAGPGSDEDVARIKGWMRERPEVRGVSDVVAGLSADLRFSSVRALRILQSAACFRIVEGRVDVVEPDDGGKV